MPRGEASEGWHHPCDIREGFEYQLALAFACPPVAPWTAMLSRGSCQPKMTVMVVSTILITCLDCRDSTLKMLGIMQCPRYRAAAMRAAWAHARGTLASAYCCDVTVGLVSSGTVQQLREV